MVITVVERFIVVVVVQLYIHSTDLYTVLSSESYSLTPAWSSNASPKVLYFNDACMGVITSLLVALLNTRACFPGGGKDPCGTVTRKV